MKEFKAKEFAKCIETDDKTKIVVNVEEMVVEASYTGPKLEKIEDLNAEWVVKLMDWQKDQKTLHKKFATMIILKARDLFEKDASLVHITVPDDEEITVCGDVHG
jgi:serine/threonine-protein phosphatase 5